MRTLAITQNITLDGRIEMLEDWFDPQGLQGDDAAMLAENARQSAAADALLVGRQTFTDLRGYWRDLEDDRTGISAYLNGVAKYVVSGSLTDADTDWDGTTVLSGDTVDQVRALKEQDGADIVCTGSITLTHALLGAGLVDEVRLFWFPWVQGRGRTLFPDGSAVQRLALDRVAAYDNGIALTVHRLG